MALRAPWARIIGAAALAFAPFGAHGQDGAWVARRLPWYGLPNRELIGTAPTAVLTLPAKAGECGALSDLIDPFAARGPVVLKVTLRVDSGSATISVRGEDGVDPLSRPRTLMAKDGEAVVYIGVEPGAGPRVIALCGAGGEDEAGGEVEVLGVEAARVDAIGADDMARVNLGML
jgi:hypothetical protein